MQGKFELQACRCWIVKQQKQSHIQSYSSNKAADSQIKTFNASGITQKMKRLHSNLQHQRGLSTTAPTSDVPDKRTFFERCHSDHEFFSKSVCISCKRLFIFSVKESHAVTLINNLQEPIK